MTLKWPNDVLLDGLERADGPPELHALADVATGHRRRRVEGAGDQGGLEQGSRAGEAGRADRVRVCRGRGGLDRRARQLDHVGRLTCEVGVALAAPAEFIVFRVGRREGVVEVVE